MIIAKGQSLTQNVITFKNQTTPAKHTLQGTKIQGSASVHDRKGKQQAQGLGHVNFGLLKIYAGTISLNQVSCWRVSQ